MTRSYIVARDFTDAAGKPWKEGQPFEADDGQIKAAIVNGNVRVGEPGEGAGQTEPPPEEEPEPVEEEAPPEEDSEEPTA